MVAGATDMQKPHDEDEAYFVIRGQAKMKLGEEERKSGLACALCRCDRVA